MRVIRGSRRKPRAGQQVRIARGIRMVKFTIFYTILINAAFIALAIILKGFPKWLLISYFSALAVDIVLIAVFFRCPRCGRTLLLQGRYQMTIDKGIRCCSCGRYILRF